MTTYYHRTADEAHREAKDMDARDYHHKGEQLEVVIETSPERNNGRDAVTHVGRHHLTVFIHPGRTTLYEGDRVRVKLSEVHDNFARAVALYVVD